jgi:hypothetical protein
MPSFQQNASQWSFSHLSPEAALHSRHSTLSPLQTPSGSFDSLQNISPQAGLPTPTTSANGDNGFSHYYPPQVPPTTTDLHSSYGPYSTTLMQAMPPQNFHMLRTMWGPPQHQSDALLHSPAGLGQFQQFQPIMMQPGAMNEPLQDATAEVVNTGKRGRKRKNTTASGTAPTRKRKKTNARAVTAAPATAAAVCGVGPVSSMPSYNAGSSCDSEPQIITASSTTVLHFGRL